MTQVAQLVLRTDTRRHLLALALLVVTSAAIIGVNPFRQTLAPVDLLVNTPGFQSAGVHTAVVNAERSDALDVFLPNWRFLRRELRAGRLPVWNPLNQLGSPGIQSPFFEGLTVPFLVFAIVPDEPLGYTLAITSNFLVAAVGCYCLLFLLFGSRLAAVFGALVFAFSGFNVAWAHWPHVTTSAWIPWVLAGELGYWQTGRTRWAGLFAVGVAMLILGGFPFVAVVGAVAAALLAACLVAQDRRGSRPVRATLVTLGGLTLAGLAGAALAAPALAGMVQFLGETNLSYRAGGTGLDPSDLAHLFGANWHQKISVERTFYCGVVAAVLGVAGILRALTGRERLGLFGLLLAAFVLATAYGLGPHALISLIPGFGFNPWSRAGVLTGLALAVLSASFIRWTLSTARTPRARVIVTTGLAAALFFQVADMAVQFAVYNAKPPREAYFPSTPSLDYVAARLEPFQSVLADAGYLVSGTVSGYGLPELFAHGFRTPGQRALMTAIVARPFTTPTASLFDCGRTDFSGPAASLAAIRFFLVTATECLETLATTEGTGQDISPPLDGPLTGAIQIDRTIRPTLAAVALTRAGGDGDAFEVGFDMFLGDTRVASSVLPGAAVSEGRLTRFPLALAASLQPGTYRYTVTVLHPSPDSRLHAGVFTSGGTYAIGATPAAGTPRLALIRPRDPAGLLLHRPEPNITVAENPAVSGGAYFVRTLDAENGIDFSAVEVRSYTPSDFRLRYDGTAPGFIVVPMRTADEWAATVDDAPVPIVRFHDVFAAVAVDGPADIHMYFRTRRLAVLALLGWMAALALLAGASRLSGPARD